MTNDPAWEADLKRCPPDAWLREPSIWAIAVYRFGQRNDRRRRGPVRWLLDRWYWLVRGPVELLTGISIPKSATIGPGVRIHHFGGVVIHEKAVIGANCTLRHGVTIGDRHHGGPVPVLEDDVEIGVYAQILGGLRIGRGARIGAMAVVLQDVPAGATAVGNPARVVERSWTDAAGPPDPAGTAGGDAVSPSPTVDRLRRGPHRHRERLDEILGVLLSSGGFVLQILD